MEEKSKNVPKIKIEGKSSIWEGLKNLLDELKIVVKKKNIDIQYKGDKYKED
jgi:hypothetical protein